MGWGKQKHWGLQSGSQTGRNTTAERHERGLLGEESQVWKHGANVRVQWENGVVHEESEGWVVCRKRRGLPRVQGKAGVQPPVTCWSANGHLQRGD